MKHIRIIGLSLVAVFALCAMTASAASAHEVLFLLDGGSFPATVKGKDNNVSTLEVKGGGKITCKKTTGHGELGSSTEGGGHTAHLGTLLILFEECSTTIITKKVCTSTDGAPSGDIHVPNLVWHLGLADPGNVPALLVLLPSGGFSFECGGITETVTGSVIGEFKEVGGGAIKENTPYSTVDLSFTQSGGVQHSTEFLLSLTTPENELMTGQTLTSSGLLSGQSGQESLDELEGLKNSENNSAELLFVLG